MSAQGFFYNIIRVPPLDESAAKEDSADLKGAQVICSIRAAEARKPSYYHSFGEIGLHTTVKKKGSGLFERVCMLDVCLACVF